MTLINNLIEIKHINKIFNSINGEKEAIEDISFNVNEGEFISLVGSSGCGKSTFLSIIAGILNKTSGEIIIYKDKYVIGYMFQNDALFEHLTVKQNITLGLKILGIDTIENINYALMLLKKYNLDNCIDKYPKELSGGMKQRVALIRTLAIKPDILLLDEPFSNLDYTTRKMLNDDIFNIVKELNITTIMVTHDIGDPIYFINIKK